MTDLTTGQRIAQCRKKLGLSQEALGEKVGVSRQAISKWEADAALPDIDKLIALSRLFDLSVGWLLGVEEQPQPKEEATPISEELLHKIEEVVRRYQMPKKKLSTGKKVLIGIAAALVLWSGFRFLDQWRFTRTEIGYLSGQLRNNNEQNADILDQLDTLKDRIDSINTTVEEAAGSLASYRLEPALNESGTAARVDIAAVPKTWHESWTAELSVRSGENLIAAQSCHWDGSALTAAVDLELADGLEYWLVITYPDGTQESVPMEDEAAQDLKRNFTILYRGTPTITRVEKDTNPEILCLHFQVYDMYLRRPDHREKPEDWFWTRAEYVILRTRDGVQEEAAVCPILSAETEAKTTELWGGSFTVPMEQPQEGDTCELWVMLELANGISHEACTGTWLYTGGEFVPQ